MISASDGRQRQKVTALPADDERDRMPRREERGALRQRERFGHHGIRRVTREEREEHDRQGGRARRDSRQPCMPAYGNTRRGGEDEARRVDTLAKHNGGLSRHRDERGLQLRGRASVCDEPERRHLPRQ